MQGSISSVLFLQMSKSGWKKFVLVLVPLPQGAEQGLQSDHPICGPQSTKHVTSDERIDMDTDNTETFVVFVTKFKVRLIRV